MNLLELLKAVEKGTEDVCPICCGIIADGIDDRSMGFGHAPDCQLKAWIERLETEPEDDIRKLVQILTEEQSQRLFDQTLKSLEEHEKFLQDVGTKQAHPKQGWPFK